MKQVYLMSLIRFLSTSSPASTNEWLGWRHFQNSFNLMSWLRMYWYSSIDSEPYRRPILMERMKLKKLLLSILILLNMTW